MVREKDPNSTLAALIAESGYTPTQMANRLNELSNSYGQPASFNHTSIARWLRGERPRGRTVQLLAHVLGQAVGRRLSAADMGMDERTRRTDVGLAFDVSLADSLVSISDLFISDVRRRRFLTAAAFLPAAFTTPALRWVTSARAMGAGRPVLEPVEAAEVEAIRRLTGTFRELDNRFGGGYARSTVVQYLHAEVAPMLREGARSEAVNRALFGAAAELVLLAGWMAFDTEQHSVAQRYLIQALRLAQEACNEALGAEVLNGMSIQTGYLGFASEAIDLAQTAQYSARRAGSAVLRSESRAVEAHGHALAGDSRRCAVALIGAEQALAQAAGQQTPAFLAYFDDRYLAAKIGRALLDSGDAQQAREAIIHSLAMRGGFARGRVFNLAMLAQAEALAGEVEAACRTGRIAVDAARDMHSLRALREIAAVRRALAPSDTHVVREFDAHAAALLSAGPSVPALPTGQ